METAKKFQRVRGTQEWHRTPARFDGTVTPPKRSKQRCAPITTCTVIPLSLKGTCAPSQNQSAATNRPCQLKFQAASPSPKHRMRKGCARNSAMTFVIVRTAMLSAYGMD